MKLCKHRLAWGLSLLPALLLVLHGCSSHPPENDFDDLNAAIDTVKAYLQRNGTQDVSLPAVACKVRQEEGGYFVLCEYEIDRPAPGNHTLFILDKKLKIVEIIAGY